MMRGVSFSLLAVGCTAEVYGDDFGGGKYGDDYMDPRYQPDSYQKNWSYDTGRDRLIGLGLYQ